jgi:hypothetical protein
MESLREWDHLEDPGVYGRIILKWLFEKWDGLTAVATVRIGKSVDQYSDSEDSNLIQ